MDLLRDQIRPLYLQYLSAALGSALISSIYSVVDMAMVGQYQGPRAQRPWRSSAPSGTSSTARAC